MHLSDYFLLKNSSFWTHDIKYILHDYMILKIKDYIIYTYTIFERIVCDDGEEFRLIHYDNITLNVKV